MPWYHKYHHRTLFRPKNHLYSYVIVLIFLSPLALSHCVQTSSPRLILDIHKLHCTYAAPLLQIYSYTNIKVRQVKDYLIALIYPKKLQVFEVSMLHFDMFRKDREY